MVINKMTPTQRLVTLRQKQLARSALFLKTAPFLHDDLQFVVHYLPQSTVLIWKNYFNEIRHIENTLIKNRCFIVKMCLIESGHLGPKCDEPWAAETAIVWSQPTIFIFDDYICNFWLQYFRSQFHLKCGKCVLFTQKSWGIQNISDLKYPVHGAPSTRLSLGDTQRTRTSLFSKLVDKGPLLPIDCLWIYFRY